MKKRNSPLRSFISAPGMGQVLTVFAGLILMCAVFNLINPNFLGARNRANLLRQIAPFIIVGIGQGFVCITGNIDLSIGSVIGMSCMLSATLMTRVQMNPLYAILITMAACLLVGLINGELVARCKLPPFIGTLGTMTICRGVAQLVNNNMNTDSIVGAGSRWREAAQAFRDFCYYDKTFGVFNTFWIALALWLVFNFILSSTRTGRYMYAVGSNIEAAKLSGVNTQRTVIKAYLTSAFCAGIVGLITCATTGTGTMDAGVSYEMYAVAAAVIGGISTLGGSGILAAVLVGASVWAAMNNGLQFAGAPVALRNIVIGVIVILAVLIDVIRRTGRISARKKSA